MPAVVVVVVAVPPSTFSLFVVVVVVMLASLPAAPCGGTSSESRAYTCFGQRYSMPPAISM